MADRIIVYPSAIPLDTDVLLPQQYTMIALGYALQASYGQSTVVVGLACNPTAPASMQVTVAPGAIIAPSVLEATAFGSLLADASDPLVKMGINTTSSSFTLSAPATSGQTQNYLIQASFTEADDTPQTLTYFNSLNPQQPYTGPANSGTPQNTRRAQRCNLQVKPGTPAATGTQTTPPVDTGWVGLWVIQVAAGQASITAGSISAYSGAPLLAPFLASHHGGVPGQAPKINLGTEVTGILSPSNLPTAVGASSSYAGNPNGNIAGTAASGSAPPSLCWDTTNLKWWTCVLTGTASTAVWAAVTNDRSSQYFTSSGTFVVPVGVTTIRVTVVGAGGGGGGSTTGVAGNVSIAGGGAGGSFGIGKYNVTPGQSYSVTVGAGGSGGAAGGGNGVSGGTSSFGSLISALGGLNGVGCGTLVPPAIWGSPSVQGPGSGGDVNSGGGPATYGQAPNLNEIVGGGGGNGPYGGGAAVVAGNTVSVAGRPGAGPGAGGGGAANPPNGAGAVGGAGASGLVLVEWS